LGRGRVKTQKNAVTGFLRSHSNLNQCSKHFSLI
jgi:hypothetical protein